MKILILILASLLSFTTFASEGKNPPYFASIRADEANIRTGPNVRYPIRWVYKKENWPVKVISKFENWRKIEDMYGEAGWIYSNLLSSKRRVITQSAGVQEIYRLPLITSKVVAIAESGVIADLDFCKNGWCKISIKEREGWIQESHLWGNN